MQLLCTWNCNNVGIDFVIFKIINPCSIFPINIEGIKFATAQLIAKRDGKIYLEQIKGIPTTLAIGNKVLKNLKAKGPETPVYKNYYLLTSEQAGRLFLEEAAHLDYRHPEDDR